MMRPSPKPGTLYLFRPPYRDLEPLLRPAELPAVLGIEGAALVWCMQPVRSEMALQAVRRRIPGMGLVVVLPPADSVTRQDEIYRMIELCRPSAVLPHHEEPHPDDLRTLLGASPDDLPAAVVDFLGWRGLRLNTELRWLIRRTLELSCEIRSVTALSRGIYLSRRALGRRFTSNGLPPPSHWLHMGRVLRATIRIHEGDSPLTRIAFEFGYPDAFALSNQMKRLTGFRPSEARERLGWEWLLEAWMRKEAGEGGFSDALAAMIEPRAPGLIEPLGATAGRKIPDPDSTTRPAAPREHDVSRR